MRIAAIQYRPAVGDIGINVSRHLGFVKEAASHSADIVFFPELSLTGYEPGLADSLAVCPLDPAFHQFQVLCDQYQLVIGIGAPLSAGSRVQIGTIWFKPGAPPVTYSKQQLHPDETSFFVPGDSQLIIQVGEDKIAPAICYESLQPGHSERAASMGANVYLASVAKPTGGLKKAVQHYPAIANKLQLYVVMANCIGPSDNFVSVGRSAAWGRNGELLAAMGEDCEGMLLVNTDESKAEVYVL